MENERTGGRAGGKRIDERADFGALRNGIAACVVAIHCVYALYTAFPTTASVAGEVKGYFISPHNGIHFGWQKRAGGKAVGYGTPCFPNGIPRRKYSEYYRQLGMHGKSATMKIWAA